MLPRLRDAARPEQKLGDLDAGAGGIASRHLEGSPVGVERLQRAGAALQDLSQFVPGQDELRLALEHRPERRLGLREFTGGAEPGCPCQLIDDADPALRVRQRAVRRAGAAGQVAERLEPPPGLRVVLGRRAQRPIDRLERRAQPPRHRPLLLDHVVPLARVLVQAEQLRVGRVDEVEIVLHDRGEIAPAEVNAGVDALGDDLPRRFAGWRLAESEQIDAGQTCRLPKPQQRVHGRRHVAELRVDRDPLAGPLAARQLDDQGYLEHLPVDEDQVIHLAVIHQALAVVGEQNDHRVPVEAQFLEPPNQLADHRVGGGDLAVVGIAVAFGERRRRRVGGVRLVEVEEQEERRSRDLAKPARGRGQGLPSWPLQLAEPTAGLEPDAVVVNIEPTPDSGLAAQYVGRNEAAGRVPVPAERFRQRRRRRVQAVAGVVPQAVLGRQQAGEQAGVRRQGHVDVCVGALEQHTLACEAVDGGCFDPVVAVGRQPVRAQGVDRDEHHVRAHRGGPRRLFGGRRRGAGQKRAAAHQRDSRGAAHLSSSVRLAV